MRSLLPIVLLLACTCAPAQWKNAEPGYRFSFPRDHGVHPEFKTEWLYFTGNVEDSESNRFGFELVFFRHGILPPGERAKYKSRFIVGDLYFAHFTITDVPHKQFHFARKQSRGAFGEAGFSRHGQLAWIDDWNVTLADDGIFHISASAPAFGLHMQLRPEKSPVVHGRNGASRKGVSEGAASHYVSITSMEAKGNIRVNGREKEVHGLAWLDHEWFTNQLEKDQVGWDWFSLQFGDGTELMLYQLRQRSGTAAFSPAGTFIDAQGNASGLEPADIVLKPGRTWASTQTRGTYPVEWEIEVKPLNLRLRVTTQVPDQELVLEPTVYWEGAVDAQGSRDGVPVQGRGYMEMTGYASEFNVLQRGQ
jgi:predicted secreted hydrolase